MIHKDQHIHSNELSIDQKAKICHQWIVEGKFTYQGTTFIRGVNDSSACKVLSELATMRVDDLAFHFNDFMTPSFSEKGISAKGFSIGKGRKLYWYISPWSGGSYRCLGYDPQMPSTLGYPRFIQPHQIVTVHYK